MCIYNYIYIIIYMYGTLIYIYALLVQNSTKILYKVICGLLFRDSQALLMSINLKTFL